MSFSNSHLATTNVTVMKRRHVIYGKLVETQTNSEEKAENIQNPDNGTLIITLTSADVVVVAAVPPSSSM